MSYDPFGVAGRWSTSSRGPDTGADRGQSFPSARPGTRRPRDNGVASIAPGNGSRHECDAMQCAGRRALGETSAPVVCWPLVGLLE